MSCLCKERLCLGVVMFYTSCLCTLHTRRPRREFSKGRNLLIIPRFERVFALVFGTLVLFPLNYRASKNFMVVYFVLNALRSINRFQKLSNEACDGMSAVQAMGWTPEPADLRCCAPKHGIRFCFLRARSTVLPSGFFIVLRRDHLCFADL